MAPAWNSNWPPGSPSSAASGANAATSVIEPRHGAWSMPSPPSRAPKALLPRLKAAMLRLEARLWPAPHAFSSTHICSGGTVAKAAAPSRPTNSIGRDAVMHGEGHGRQHHAEKRQAAEQGRHQLPVGELAADEISGDQPDAEHQQDRRHGGLRKAGDLGQHRRDIGEDGEDTPIQPSTVISKPSSTCGRVSAARSERQSPASRAASRIARDERTRSRPWRRCRSP